MPDVNSIYQSQFLNAAQLKGQPQRVTIEGATAEVIGQGERASQKIILKFHKCKPRLPLNKTNAMFLSSAFGPDTANWIGHVVELKPVQVLYQGAFVAAIRIDLPGGPASTPAAPAPALAPVAPAAAAPAPGSNPVAAIESDLPWEV